MIKVRSSSFHGILSWRSSLRPQNRDMCRSRPVPEANATQTTTQQSTSSPLTASAALVITMSDRIAGADGIGGGGGNGAGMISLMMFWKTAELHGMTCVYKNVHDQAAHYCVRLMPYDMRCVRRSS
mgnify:CR=1 FL=1